MPLWFCMNKRPSESIAYAFCKLRQLFCGETKIWHIAHIKAKCRHSIKQTKSSLYEILRNSHQQYRLQRNINSVLSEICCCYLATFSSHSWGFHTYNRTQPHIQLFHTQVSCFQTGFFGSTFFWSYSHSYWYLRTRFRFFHVTDSTETVQYFNEQPSVSHIKANVLFYLKRKWHTREAKTIVKGRKRNAQDKKKMIRILNFHGMLESTQLAEFILFAAVYAIFHPSLSTASSPTPFVLHFTLPTSFLFSSFSASLFNLHRFLFMIPKKNPGKLIFHIRICVQLVCSMKTNDPEKHTNSGEMIKCCLDSLCRFSFSWF